MSPKTSIAILILIVIFGALFIYYISVMNQSRQGVDTNFSFSREQIQEKNKASIKGSSDELNTNETAEEKVEKDEVDRIIENAQQRIEELPETIDKEEKEQEIRRDAQDAIMRRINSAE